MHSFDGIRLHNSLLKALSEKMQFKSLRLVSVVFAEDKPSQIYTRLKHEAAVQVGIEFDRIDHSFNDPVSLAQSSIRHACSRSDVTGVMIQKPGKRTWAHVTGKSPARFDDWWRELTAAIDPAKDVDCLTRKNLSKVYEGTWFLLPATVKAVLYIVAEALKIDAQALTAISFEPIPELRQLNVGVVGRSELVGRPLAAVLQHKGAHRVALLGNSMDPQLLAGTLLSSDVVVSATGKPKLITADMIKPGAIVIDVGAPGADVDFESVASKASFMTPVPNGVGPVTVACLLENLLQLTTS
jgi:methylenetetrahydrofolate dehydrogenase (NADP+)/methenyltetrahydrofolate cyclohydrolase